MSTRADRGYFDKNNNPVAVGGDGQFTGGVYDLQYVMPNGDRIEIFAQGDKVFMIRKVLPTVHIPFKFTRNDGSVCEGIFPHTPTEMLWEKNDV